MLKVTPLTPLASTNRLVRIWMLRYLPHLANLEMQDNRFPAAELITAASLEERTKTIATVRRILQINCERAGLETNSLYSYIPNIVHLSETRRITEAVRQVYEKLLDIYQQQEPPSHFLKFIDNSFDLFSKLALPALMLPTVTQLAADVEPILLHIQQQHLHTQNPRTIGFLTTQIHFSTREILRHLNAYEQVLLSPYLKFIEEQVCIPWQRVCAAAAKHMTNSPTFIVVEFLLPLCHDIATQVYQQSLRLYPQHTSRRGTLLNPEIASSILRDLTMIQGYILLCVLEKNMAAIKQELIPLCVMVFPSVKVAWELVEGMLALLIREMLDRLSLEQKELLLPYTQATQDLFAKANPRHAYSL
ncbi:MAG TPA: hypothetical protein V6C65_39250 [Allocoleopsis sp.]